MTDKPENKKNNDFAGRFFVGILLLAYSIGLVNMLINRLLDGFLVSRSNETLVSVNQVDEALIMIYAGGIGSLIYAIRGFLLQACDKHDFDQAYIPWYIFWPVQGALLGLIFYFAISGGLLLITFKSESQSMLDLNTWSLAAIGAFAGLFSKYAIEKLRKVFLIIFSIEENQDEKKKNPQSRNTKKE